MEELMVKPIALSIKVFFGAIILYVLLNLLSVCLSYHKAYSSAREMCENISRVVAEDNCLDSSVEVTQDGEEYGSKYAIFSQRMSNLSNDNKFIHYNLLDVAGFRGNKKPANGEIQAIQVNEIDVNGNINDAINLGVKDSSVACVQGGRVVLVTVTCYGDFVPIGNYKNALNGKMTFPVEYKIPVVTTTYYRGIN